MESSGWGRDHDYATAISALPSVRTRTRWVLALMKFRKRSVNVPMVGSAFQRTDTRGSKFIRPLRPSMVTTISTPPTPDVDEEDEPKPVWIPCPSCHALPEDGQFRLINLRWGLVECTTCKKERKQAAERAAFDAGANHEERVRAFMRSKKQRLTRRGWLRSKVEGP